MLRSSNGGLKRWANDQTAKCATSQYWTTPVSDRAKDQATVVSKEVALARGSLPWKFTRYSGMKVSIMIRNYLTVMIDVQFFGEKTVNKSRTPTPHFWSASLTALSVKVHPDWKRAWRCLWAAGLGFRTGPGCPAGAWSCSLAAVWSGSSGLTGWTALTRPLTEQKTRQQLNKSLLLKQENEHP